jgi:hypothetical protein
MRRRVGECAEPVHSTAFVALGAEGLLAHIATTIHLIASATAFWISAAEIPDPIPPDLLWSI